MPIYQIALLFFFGIATLWLGCQLDKKNRQKELAAKRQSENRASQGRLQTSLIYVCTALKAAWSTMIPALISKTVSKINLSPFHRTPPLTRVRRSSRHIALSALLQNGS